MSEVSNNIHIHEHNVTQQERSKLKKHKPFVVWLTGLSGSGKSTLANAVERRLYERGLHTYILDGDNIRSGLNKNLKFTDDDRKENIRRIGEVSKLFLDSGTIVLTAFISPFIEDREAARKIIGDNFIEVFVDADLSTCEERDPKGLYEKARAGIIPNFTGISSPYERPENPDITVNTSNHTVEYCTDKIINYLISKL